MLYGVSCALSMMAGAIAVAVAQYFYRDRRIDGLPVAVFTKPLRAPKALRSSAAIYIGEIGSGIRRDKMRG